MRFINFPHPYSSNQYQNSINKIIEILSKNEGLKAVYQIGSISDYGISDIDLIAIYKKGVLIQTNVLQNLTKIERYGFTHGVFGISEDHFKDVNKFSFFHNYHHLFGKKFPVTEREKESKSIKLLKRQVAYEFLISNYISRTIEYTYKTINVRSILLSVKAILYDLNFLEIHEGELHNLVKELIHWRKNWFIKPVSRDKLISWFLEFYQVLYNFLSFWLHEFELYLPVKIIRYAKNITIKKAATFSYDHSGITLPSILHIFGKKYFKLNNKINNFIFNIPFNRITDKKILKDRYTFIKEVYSYNDQYLPHFNPLWRRFF